MLFLPPEIAEIQYLCLCRTFCCRICRRLSRCWRHLGCWGCRHCHHCCCRHCCRLCRCQDCRFRCCYCCPSLVDCCLPQPLPLFPPATAVACPHCCQCCLLAPLPLLLPPQLLPLFLPLPPLPSLPIFLLLALLPLCFHCHCLCLCLRRTPPLLFLLPLHHRFCFQHCRHLIFHHGSYH
jgi:hypothetical protein